MQKIKNSVWKSYKFPFVLICGIVIGSLIGWFAPQFGVKLKPLGDIFLNLVFSVVVPVVAPLQQPLVQFKIRSTARSQLWVTQLLMQSAILC